MAKVGSSLVCFNREYWFESSRVVVGEDNKDNRALALKIGSRVDWF